MKALVVTAVLCAFICFVQSEIGFNLSGSFNPGFTIGPARRRDAHVDVDQGNDDTWPHPDTINKFPVPDAFVNAVTEATEENEDVTAQASRGRPRHHRFHRH